MFTANSAGTIPEKRWLPSRFLQRLMPLTAVVAVLGVLAGGVTSSANAATLPDGSRAGMDFTCYSGIRNNWGFRIQTGASHTGITVQMSFVWKDRYWNTVASIDTGWMSVPPRLYNHGFLGVSTTNGSKLFVSVRYRRYNGTPSAWETPVLTTHYNGQYSAFTLSGCSFDY